MEPEQPNFQHKFRLYSPRQKTTTPWESLPDDVRVGAKETVKKFMKVEVEDSIDSFAWLKAQPGDPGVWSRFEGIQGGIMFLDCDHTPNAAAVRWVQENRAREWGGDWCVQFK